MDADRDVIGDHRHVERVPDVAEVVDDLGLAGAGVEGRGDDDGVDAGRLGRPGMADHPVGRRVDDAGEDRHAAAARFIAASMMPRARRLVVEHHLAGRAEHEEAMHAAVDQVVDDAVEGRR